MKRILAWGVMVASVLLIALGLWRGELAVIWQKASRICLECMGIG